MAPVQRRATRAVHLKCGGALCAQGAGRRVGRAARYARTLTSGDPMKGQGGASLGRKRCRPLSALSSALWFRARSRYTPLGRRRWSAHDEHEDTASRVSAICGWPPGAGRIGAQLRLVVGRYAAPAARYAARRLVAAAPNHDVATTWCRYAAQVRHTRPKLLYETQWVSK